MCPLPQSICFLFLCGTIGHNEATITYSGKIRLGPDNCKSFIGLVAVITFVWRKEGYTINFGGFLEPRRAVPELEH